MKKTINTTASINKKKNEELARRQQKVRLVLLILLVIAIVSVTAVDVVIVLQRRAARAGAEEATLFPETYESTGAALPDDPKYVFYNSKKDRIETENIPQLPGLVDDVDDANVVIAFRTDSEYVDTVETDDGPVTVYDQTLQLAVVRKRGWSLIDETSFTYRLDVDKVGEALLRDEAVEYLTDILG